MGAWKKRGGPTPPTADPPAGAAGAQVLRPEPARRSGSPAATLLAALLGFFVVTLDAVIVNVALPEIGADLGGGIRGLQWVVDGYTLMFAGVLLSAGSLTDRIGARRTFALGTAVFVVASVACGLALDLGVLIGFRFVQGIAAGVMMPSSMALIGQAYPDPARRARAVATWSMGAAVASTSAPVLGGLLALASWRWIFLVNVPVGVVTLALLRRAAPSAHHRAGFDWPGQLTAVLAMGGLTYGAIEAGALGLTAAPVVAALLLSLVSGATFVWLQHRVPHPMLPLEMLRDRAVTAPVVIGFAFMVAYYGVPFVMSLYLQLERGLTPLGTGLAFVPMTVVGLLLLPLIPRATARVGVRVVVVAGLLLMATGLVALAYAGTVAGAEVPVGVLAALMVLVGLGAPTISPPITAALLGAVPPVRAGTASGVLNTSRQLGGALAVAVFGALLAGSAGFASGMRLSLLLGAAVVVGAAAVGRTGLDRGVRGRAGA